MEKRNRNFLPALILSFAFLSFWLLLFFFVHPASLLPILTFCVLLFFWLFFTASLLLGNTRQGFFIGIGILVFLVIGYWGAGTWLNLLLIVGILITLEYVIAQKG